MALNTIAKFESRSEPGTFHGVRRTLKGSVLYCTCPAGDSVLATHSLDASATVGTSANTVKPAVSFLLLCLLRNRDRCEQLRSLSPRSNAVHSLTISRTAKTRDTEAIPWSDLPRFSVSVFSPNALMQLLTIRSDLPGWHLFDRSPRSPGGPNLSPLPHW